MPEGSPIIATERLRLRRARTTDLEDLHRIFADPHAMRYSDTLPHTDPDQTGGWLACMVALSPFDTADFILKHAGRAIGKVGCSRRSRPSRWCNSPDGPRA